MYDKYNKFLPITENQNLSKHKGLWLAGSGTVGAVVVSGNIDGGTHGITFTISANTIIPFQVEMIKSLGGCTGFLLN